MINDIKKITAALLIAAVCAAVCCCAACAKKGAPVTNNTPRPDNSGCVVMFGDSITYMCSWQDSFDDVEVINLGISGDKVQDLIDRIDGVYAARPAKLFIMVGVNDILSGRSVDETIADWETLLDLVSGYEVYAQSMLPVDAGFGERALLVSVFNARLRALCRERGIAYIDLYPIYSDENGFLKEECTPDGLHLKAAAYEPWIERIKGIVYGAE